MPRPTKYEHPMEYISDKDVFKAVMFACKMIRQGKHPRKAVEIASYYHNVDKEKVHHYVGQRGGRKTIYA